MRRACIVASLSVGLFGFASPIHPQTVASSPTAAAAATRPTAGDSSIRPFSVHVPQGDLDDLRHRIAATRWPEKETVTDESQGVPLAMMQQLARYWATDYDWRKVEARLNVLPQFRGLGTAATLHHGTSRGV